MEIRGGASRLLIDTLRLGDVGGTMRWSSPDGERAEARYEIEIAGGAEHLTLATSG